MLSRIEDVQHGPLEVAAERDDPLLGVEGQGGALLEPVPRGVDLGTPSERAGTAVGVGGPAVVVHRAATVGRRGTGAAGSSIATGCGVAGLPDVRRGHQQRPDRAGSAADRRG